MRLVVDTNVLISALVVEKSLPAYPVELWREGRFDLLTSAEQIAEIRRVSRYPRLRHRLSRSVTGRLINRLRDEAVVVAKLPSVRVSPDPFDDYLLSLAAAGGADYLVTGDKNDLLAIGRYEGTRVVTVREFLALNHRLP